VNKLFLVGRVVRDPESRDFANGRLARISIAVSDNYTRDKTYFFDATAFDKRVDYILNYIHKGDLITIEGRLTKRKYTTKDGRNAESTDIVIDSINKLSSASKLSTEPTASVEQAVQSHVTNNQQPLQQQTTNLNTNSSAKPTFVDDANETDLDFLQNDQDKE
jgi:single-strand DNA-binding protein